MGNRAPEQNLIDSFIKELKNHANLEIKIDNLINFNCKSKTFADVEFISESQQHWVIEAKSHNSSDASNTIHKIFGEILKETGRNNRNNSKYAILIPESGREFYSKNFQLINRNKYIGFGNLVPIDCVFIFGNSGIIQMSWAELYDYFVAN